MAKKKDGPSYTSVIAEDPGKMWEAVTEATNEAAKDLIAVVNQYYSTDFPIVAAVMSMLADNMVYQTGAEGRMIYETSKRDSLLIAKTRPVREEEKG